MEGLMCHCAVCVKNECEETLVLTKEHAVRLPWTVTTVFT